MKRALLLLVATRGALAAPTVTVSARTQLVIEEVERGGAGVHVRGKLTDAGTGEGVAGRRVTVSAPGTDAVLATTSATGRFDAVLELPAGEHAVAARFGGDAIFAAGDASGRFDVGRGTLRLTLRAEDTDVASDGLPIAVDALAAGEPESVRVIVRVDDRAAGDLETGNDGRGAALLPRAVLGPPGEKRIVVRFGGNPALNPSEASALVLLTTAARFADLDVPGEPVPYERDVRVRGRLVDSEDAAVAGALVSMARAQETVDGVTDGEGRFELRLAGSALGAGPAALMLEHISRVPWRRGARVGPLSVVVLSPRPIPFIYPLAAFVLTGLSVVAYVLLRTRPWDRLVARWRRRRRKPEAAQPLDAGAGDAPVPGLKLARPSLISALRRPTDFGFTGRVSDAARGQAIPGARLSATAGDASATATADDRGHFEMDLPAGTWNVEVSAPGYLREVVTAITPHRGELRGARVDLVPVRERVFAIYREVVAPLLPTAELWGVWTPREILDHVKESGAAGALASFTAFVEETYFSAATPDEGAIGRAMEGARASRREREPVDRP